MHDLQAQANQLATAIDAASRQLDIPALQARLAQLRTASEQPDFWNERERAQTTMQEISRLQARVQPWLDLGQEASDVQELIALEQNEQSEQAEQSKPILPEPPPDNPLANDLALQLTALQARFDALKEELKFSGPYDDYDAILSIHAGAGGNDAQDWAGMLLRMYARYAEKAGWQIRTVDESPGDEAGLKSVTIEISGPFAFGKLKGEHGVHRLVRLSPFNAESRETSFAKVEVMPRVDKPEQVAIDEKDLKIDVYRSGGHGGQSVNTTDSAVRITHIPTGIVIAIQNERSQLQNKETALTILRSRLAQLQLEQHAASVRELKGPNEQAAWGNQIRSYVLHPYKQVKDLRTRFETSDIDGVLDGNLDGLVNAYLESAALTAESDTTH